MYENISGKTGDVALVGCHELLLLSPRTRSVLSIGRQRPGPKFARSKADSDQRGLECGQNQAQKKLAWEAGLPVQLPFPVQCSSTVISHVHAH